MSSADALSPDTFHRLISAFVDESHLVVITAVWQSDGFLMWFCLFGFFGCGSGGGRQLGLLIYLSLEEVLGIEPRAVPSSHAVHSFLKIKQYIGLEQHKK